MGPPLPLPAVTVSIATKNRPAAISFRKIEKTALKILKLLEQHRAELSIALVGDRAIQRLNRRYRGKNEPTDVLSFTSGELLPGGVLLLGDVVISLEKAGTQARAAGRRLDQEVEALLIHGILHLLGHDHERREEARIMRALEKKIARSLVR